MEQHGIKRRLVNRDLYESNHQENRILIDNSTNTECYKPMLLNAWTQTSTEDFLPKSNLPLIDALQDRIRKLEELFSSHSINIGEITSSVREEDNIITEPNSIRKSVQTKYKIVSSEDMEYIEPIEVEYADEDGTYLEHDLNNSDDSTRLEICLPKDEDDQQAHNIVIKQEIDQQQQQPQQPQQQQHQNKNIQKSKPQLILHAQPHENQEPHQRLYHVSSSNITSQNRGSIISVVQGASASSTYSSISRSQESSTSSSSPTFVIDNNDVMSKQNKNKNNKANYGSTSNLHEITSSKQLDSSQVQDIVNNVYVSIGPNNTKIPAHIYETIDWGTATAATRKLLITIFDREVLSTHTMTGKPSPAFKGRNMPLKQQLNPQIVADIIFAVSRKCSVPEKDVRNAITTKCADENKMSKQREKKRKSLAEINKENSLRHGIHLE